MLIASHSFESYGPNEVGRVLDFDSFKVSPDLNKITLIVAPEKPVIGFDRTFVGDLLPIREKNTLASEANDFVIDEQGGRFGRHGV